MFHKIDQLNPYYKSIFDNREVFEFRQSKKRKQNSAALFEKYCRPVRFVKYLRIIMIEN